MATVKVQKIPPKEVSNRDLDNELATFCFLFPQYKYHEARRMPYKRIEQMIGVARRIEATRMYHLTQIAAAPQSKGGKMVKKLLEYYTGMMEE